MISLTQYCKNIWKASDGTIDFLYCKESEYVDARSLCMSIAKPTSLVDDWTQTARAIGLMDALVKHGINPSQQVKQFGGGMHTYMHPSLMPHFATWLHPHFNYPVCKLMQMVTIESAHAMQKDMEIAKQPPPKFHSLTFYEINLKSNPPRFYLLECAAKDIDKRALPMFADHPNASIIFQQFQIPNRIKVIYELKKDWDRWGNIAVGRSNYCTSTLSEGKICNLLRQVCCSDVDPAICRTTYDEVDCKYETLSNKMNNKICKYFY